MKLTELSNVFRVSFNRRATKALAEYCFPKDIITKSQAFLLYIRTTVKRWLREGLIVPIRIKGKISNKVIDRTTLERITRYSSRVAYLPLAER